MSKITCLLFAIAFASHYSMSIALCYAFAIVYTSMACYIFNSTSMDNCSSFTTTFSSFTSFYNVNASTKCYSSTSSSFNSSMHIKSTNITPCPVCFLAHQHHLLLHKNSIAYILIVFVFWIIVCANCIFSLYAFPSAHSKNDDECGDDLITNGWIFNIPFLFTLFNSYLFLFFSTI